MAFRTVPTGDGSLTVYSDEYAQTMHSTSGAWDEALMKHVTPSRITERDGPVRVLDVGFGLGYNVLALIMAMRERRQGHVEIVSLEMDREAVTCLDDITFGDGRDDIYKILRAACREGFYRCPDYSVTILFGDGRCTLSRLPAEETFHAVFHDAFSPAMNPELWSLEFFSGIFRRMVPGGILTTYSAAPQVRGAMTGAGFSLYRGPSVGGKREGTLGVKLFPRQDDDGIAADLVSNYKGTPYRDPSLCRSRLEILDVRREEMRLLRLTADRPAHQG